jgi:DNA repair photolyase
MQPPIYRPTGAALEYGEYALNIYTGCNHGCTYCYAPAVTHKSIEQFTAVEVRPGLMDALKAQLDKGEITGQLIHLCFTCDPYPAKIDTTPTREVVKLLKQHGNHVQILTKGGDRARRDFDLLDGNDWFGVTYAGYKNNFQQPREEPNADLPIHRIWTLNDAHGLGIKTWVSIEPVLDPENAIRCLDYSDFIDRFMIGKMNHQRSAVPWKAFGRRAESICIQRGLNYYIKASLRAEME